MMNTFDNLEVKVGEREQVRCDGERSRISGLCTYWG